MTTTLGPVPPTAPGTDARPGRLVPVVAGGVAATAIACCATALALYPDVATDGVEAPLVGDLVLASVWPLAGALVLRSRPRNLVGWTLLSAALIGPYVLCGEYAGWAAARSGGAPLDDLAAWIAVWGYVPYLFVLPLVLLLFPDGRPLSPRWRPLVLGLVAVAVVHTLARMVAPVTADLAPTVLNPLALDAPWLALVTLPTSVLCVVGGNLAGVLCLLLRARRARGVERRQVAWLLLGGVLLLCGFALEEPFGEVAVAVGLLGPPVAVTIAMLRHGLFDVELALNRTIVFAVLSGLVVAAWAAAVLALAEVTSLDGPSQRTLVAVGLAALAAASARTAAQRVVDRWLFGDRGDPYAVVSRVGRHVAPASEATEALERLVEALRDSLRVPHVAVLDPADGTVLASAGPPTDDCHRVPGRVLGREVAELRVGCRRRGEQLSAIEQPAIEEVAGRAATLVYARRLVADVAESRSRIVLAREEERRRLRDDLHDGLGPLLAGSAHQLDALRRRLEAAGDGEGAAGAAALRDRMRDTVAEVRALVHGLRPPVLDAVGLGGALAGLVAGVDVPACTTRLDRLEGADLPAAVEVAAYAIAAEAVTNALRHSGAGRLEVAARPASGALVLTVADNGRGVGAAGSGAGVGLRSMGERAAEVGGRLDVEPTPGGGTTVRATLPLDARPDGAGART